MPAPTRFYDVKDFTVDGVVYSSIKSLEFTYKKAIGDPIRDNGNKMATESEETYIDGWPLTGRVVTEDMASAAAIQAKTNVEVSFTAKVYGANPTNKDVTIANATFMDRNDNHPTEGQQRATSSISFGAVSADGDADPYTMTDAA